MAAWRNTILATVVTATVYLLIPSSRLRLLRAVRFFYFVGLALALLVGWRAIYAQWFDQPIFQQRRIHCGRRYSR